MFMGYIDLDQFKWKFTQRLLPYFAEYCGFGSRPTSLRLCVSPGVFCLLPERKRRLARLPLNERRNGNHPTYMTIAVGTELVASQSAMTLAGMLA